MSEKRFNGAIPNQIIVDVTGTHELGTYDYTGLSEQEIKERIAKDRDAYPEEVHIGSEIPAKKRGSVAFSAARWRASWDPKAPKGDPSLN